jgi:putative transposase
MSYIWRRLSTDKRKEVLAYRVRQKRPWRRPPHFDQGNTHYHLTVACYEHRDWIGYSPQRMADFCDRLLETIHEHPDSQAPSAWCVLPNHYHLLVKTENLKSLIAALAKLHGRTSFQWNNEEDCRGRKVWHGVSDRSMRSDAHFRASTNYIHHNQVRDGYVTRWDEWPFSSAAEYLDEVGREEAIRIWKSYPILDYGKGWDDA